MLIWSLFKNSQQKFQNLPTPNFQIQEKPVYKNQNFKNHQAEISELILSKTVFIKQIMLTTNWNDTRSAYWPLFNLITPSLTYRLVKIFCSMPIV